MVALDHAFVHIKKSRRNYPAHDSIWDFRNAYVVLRNTLAQAVTSGTYTFSQPTTVQTKDGTSVTVTDASDAVVLKTLALLLSSKMQACGYHNRLAHVQGNHGSKKTVRQIHHLLNEYGKKGFVYKTDIADYYASIDHTLLYEAVRRLWKSPPAWVNLVYAAIKSGFYKEGHYYDAQPYGILRGSPLFYVLGSLYLHQVDQTFQNKRSVRYFRYMDDILIITQSRSLLRRVIKRCHGLFEQLKLSVSKPKTYIGKASKGFSFLGYHFGPKATVSVRPETVSKSLERVHRLLEQQILTKERLEKHVKGFVSWAKGGLRGLVRAETVQQTLVSAIREAGMFQQLEALSKQHTYKKRGIVWLKRCVPEYYLLR